MLRVLTLATLFPDAARPDFGVFVERQTLGLAALDDVAVRVVAPLGLPPPRLPCTRATGRCPPCPKGKYGRGCRSIGPGS